MCGLPALTVRGARATLGRADDRSCNSTLDLEVLMRTVLTLAVAALWLTNVVVLAVADDTITGEMNQLKADIKAEKEAMKADTKTKKAEMKQLKKDHKQNIKAKKREMREKNKANKDRMRAQKDAMKAQGQDLNAADQGMKPVVPDLPAPQAPGAQ